MTTESDADAVDLAIQIIQITERARKLFAEADTKLAELRKKKRGRITLPDGRTAKVIDQFRGKTKVFAPTFARRYKLTVEGKPKRKVKAK